MPNRNTAPYKGKFYPQLAKALLNKVGLPSGAAILDPFCGSGTTLLEGYLNGYSSYGCDLNPLAAKIARAKTLILEEEPDVVSEVLGGIIESMSRAPIELPKRVDNFQDDCLDEIYKWFPRPVIWKINWLLGVIRAGSGGVTRDFLEVILSSIIRDVSHQEPSDLRVRYRETKLDDADVIGLFKERLEVQFGRIEKFWKVRGYAPNSFFPAHATFGDNRRAETYSALGLTDNSIDLVLTSPPYAMALPYIDTDRLSLLTLLGIGGPQRRPIEQSLIGSREINGAEKKRLESEFMGETELPQECIVFLRGILNSLSQSKDAGFRKLNMPALLHRFLKDMNAVFLQLHRLCKAGAEAMVVIGDSRMKIDGVDIRIPTTDLTEAVAIARGFTAVERIDITVTTENLAHIKNAITENVVLRLRKGN